MRRRRRWRRGARPLLATAALAAVLSLVVAVLDHCSGGGHAPERPPTPAPPPVSAFVFSQAFIGQGAYASAPVRKNLDDGLLNGFTFWHPADAGLQQFLSQNRASTIFTMSAATKVEGLSADEIEAQRQAVVKLRDAAGVSISWNLMEEWDQGGGRWVPQGRPSYTGLSRRDARAAFTSYYLDASPPLATYLLQAPGQRGLPLVAQTDYPMNAFYAFPMGVDVCLLERGIDELGDLSTGIAFVRGAARQFGKGWGIDLSLWRTGNGSATQFDARGALAGGWSPSYVRRHLYVSYMSGARPLQLEPVGYYGADGQLNPLGQVVREFADFALRRHAGAGAPAASTAIMIPYDSGFDPKHWISQADAVWYGDIPYSDGDHMLENLLKIAYPDHELHGLAPGAPFADGAGAPKPAAFKRYLQGGGDPRPFEPMGSTRWGDGLDVIADNAALATLQQYKLVVLAGEVAIDGRLRDALRSYVQDGGTVVANAKQVTADDEPLLGVRLSGDEATGQRSTWVADGASYDEPAFTATRVTPITASVLAKGDGDVPLVTSQPLGRGRVILTTPHMLQSSAKDQLLRVGIRLLDDLIAADAIAQVSGAPIEYVVGRSPDAMLVTLVNNSGTTWNGTVSFASPPPRFALKEYVSDADVPNAGPDGKAAIAASVAPYDLKVYALETR
jgi:hypothetical protein